MALALVGEEARLLVPKFSGALLGFVSDNGTWLVFVDDPHSKPEKYEI